MELTYRRSRRHALRFRSEDDSGAQRTDLGEAQGREFHGQSAACRAIRPGTRQSARYDFVTSSSVLFLAARRVSRCLVIVRSQEEAAVVESKVPFKLRRPRTGARVNAGIFCISPKVDWAANILRCGGRVQ